MVVFIHVHGAKRLLKYVTAFDDFRMVVSASLRNNLNTNCKSCIAAFKISYVDLEVSVTPKIHALFFYVEEFFEKKVTGTGILQRTGHGISAF